MRGVSRACSELGRPSRWGEGLCQTPPDTKQPVADLKRFIRLRGYLDANEIDWEVYLVNLLEGLAPPPTPVQPGLSAAFSTSTALTSGRSGRGFASRACSGPQTWRGRPTPARAEMLHRSPSAAHRRPTRDSLDGDTLPGVR